eukprot:TRINITY_DN4819_c0_g1_i2.p1 TRINITY_DN4819_c0_g1~~TRINITY_DN4819_c0_g1_i2.p1  ORF type:complete len:235 (+),score=33.50 TRINITY_DN4819_c0_g1_i2:195-899(+)
MTHFFFLIFKDDKVAKAVGTIALGGPSSNKPLSGLLLTKDFQHHLVSPEDLHSYTNLHSSEITQKLSVPCTVPRSILRTSLCQLYDGVDDIARDSKPSLLVHDSIYVITESRDKVTLEWVSNPVNDMLADSIVAVILQIESNPSSMRVGPVAEISHFGKESKHHLEKIQMLFSKHFGDVQADYHRGIIVINVDGTTAAINFKTHEIECEDPQLKSRVVSLLKHISSAVFPVEKQ